MSLSVLLYRISLPAPKLDTKDALNLLRDHYGMEGSAEPLGSRQDLNFRTNSSQGRFVLKICRGDYATIELQAQHAALAVLRQAGLLVPVVRGALDGSDLISVECAGQVVQIRLLEYLEGQTLTNYPHLGAELFAQMGETAARVGRALAGFQHPGAIRTVQWDPRHAGPLVEHLLPALPDAYRHAVANACAQASARLEPLRASLPEQVVHLDITDDNTLWQRNDEQRWQLNGVIDYGDLVRTWRIADLAITCASLLHHCDGNALAMLPAVAAYHAYYPLQHAELQALWPLIVLRGCVLVSSSAHQLQLDPTNHYILENLAHEWQIFNVASKIPGTLIEAAIFEALSMTNAPRPIIS